MNLCSVEEGHRQWKCVAVCCCIVAVCVAVYCITCCARRLRSIRCLFTVHCSVCCSVSQYIAVCVAEVLRASAFSPKKTQTVAEYCTVKQITCQNLWPRINGLIKFKNRTFSTVLVNSHEHYHEYNFSHGACAPGSRDTKSARGIARNCVHVIVGGIWCVEEVGNHYEQETGQNCGFGSSRNKWIFSSGSLLRQGPRRRREALKQCVNGDK